MASELTINLSLAYSDAFGAEDSLALVNGLLTPAVKQFVHLKQLVTITEVPLNLGGIVSPGYLIIKNLDDTNFVEMRVGTGGTRDVKVRPGLGAVVPFGSGVTAPYLIADTASVWVEYILISN